MRLVWATAVSAGLAQAGMACSVAPATSLLETHVVSEQYGVSAWYEGATTAYPHGVLGDEVEAERLLLFTPRVSSSLCGFHRIGAGEAHVFEDVAPRFADLDGDGRAEIIAVRSHFDLGAQLVVYRETDGGLVLDAATDYIGQRFRWLAPVGAADLDGDGFVEVAFVDRPHLAKVLRVFRYRDGALEPVAEAGGVTNHRIGERDIAGGIRDCGTGPEMIVASADWTRLLAVRLVEGALQADDIGPHRGRESFAEALACR